VVGNPQFNLGLITQDFNDDGFVPAVTPNMLDGVVACFDKRQFIIHQLLTGAALFGQKTARFPSSGLDFSQAASKA
jgi:hypothetical protein